MSQCDRRVMAGRPPCEILSFAPILPNSERVLHRKYGRHVAAESRNRSFAAILYNYM